MGKNVTGAANPQGSPTLLDPSETIRRAPPSKKVIEAYILGCLHDGTLNKKKRYRISQKGKEWLEFLQKLLKMCGYNSWIYKEGRERKVYVLETLADFLDFRFDAEKKLKREDEKAAYVRGFFDAEGGIPHSPTAKFYIQLSQKNRKDLLQIKAMLADLGIKTGEIHNPSKRVDPNYWRMYVAKSSHRKFLEKIGTWHPRKIAILRRRVKI